MANRSWIPERRCIAGLCVLLAACRGESAPAVSTLGSDTHPAWSPDGQTIAFISNRDGVAEERPVNFEIYLAAPDGSAERRLTFNQDFDADLAWSPDGSRLLFKSFQDGNDEVYVVDAAGGAPQNLTHSSAADGGAIWAPDGSAILFVSDREAGEDRFYLMDVDGTNVRPLPGAGVGHSPAWSPDGRKIAFVSARDGNAEIYVMEADGSNVRRVTDDPLENGYPRWSTNGSALVHTAGSFETDRWSLVFTDVESLESRVLVDDVDSGNAAWAPTGDKLVFGRYQIRGDGGGDDSRLYVVELATGTETQVSRPPSS